MAQDPSAPAQMTMRDYVTQQATKLNIPPALALAMIEQESGGVHSDAAGLKTSSAGARGFMQLMPATARGLQVDPTDPIGNIDGGLRYFKQQLDSYKGDVRLALAAYNAGPGNVVDRVPDIPETQDYVQKILGKWQAGDQAPAEQAAPATAAPPAGSEPARMISPAGADRQTPAAAPVPEEAGMLASLAASFDPRTFEGRVNWSATAAATAATVMTRNPRVGMAVRAGVAPWLVRVLGPPAAAAVAGGAVAGAEQALGTAPPETSALETGLMQGALDAAGSAFFWPIRRLGGAFLGSRVGKQATEAVGRLFEEERGAARTVATSIRERAREAVAAARAMRNAAAAEARPVGDVSAVSAAARASGAPRVAAAVERVAQAELDTSAELMAATRAANNLLAQAPSRLGTGAAVKETLAGPTKHALDLAGQRVAEAAAEGPMLDTVPLRVALREMTSSSRPASIFGQQETEAAGIGFLHNALNKGAAAAVVRPEERASLHAAVAHALGVNPSQLDPRLPGLLGRIQALPDKIPFAEAHQIKMLLDETVNWDRVAKRHLERITKGLRQTLRSSMAGFAPYDQATAAYQAIVPLYRRGIGQRMLKLAQRPDGATQLAEMLKRGDASEAEVVRSLLVDQAAAGGDAALGQRAWDSVRDTYTYDHLLQGPVGKLSERVRTLATQNPEFAKVVYGDLSGQKVLSNLDRIGEAVVQAQAKLSEQQAGATAAISAAERLDRRSAELTARQHIAELTKLRKELQGSSVGAIYKWDSQVSNLIRAIGLGPRSIWGALSITRLLESATGDDLLRWGAYSDKNTQMLVNLLLNNYPNRAAAGVARAVGTAATQPDPETAPTR